MTDPHADLRAMLEALPADIQWEPQCGRIELRAPDGLTHVQMDDLMSWLLRAPALVRALLEERDALQAEVERLRAKPVTPEQLFSSSKVIWEGWVRARDEEAGCVLDLFNGRVDRSRYVRVVEADQPQKPVHHKWPADPVEPAKPAEPISDELRLRCELAGRLIPAWVVEGHFNNHNVTNVEVAKVAHNIADSLIAEARRRKEAKP